MMQIFVKIQRLLRKWNKSKFSASIERAVQITEAVKAIVNSSGADVLTALTPFQQDEKLLTSLRLSIGYVSDLLGIAEATGKQSQDILFKEIGEVLEKRSPQFKKLFYRELAAAVAYSLEDGKLTAWEAFTLTQTVYRMLKDKELYNPANKSENEPTNEN